MKAPLYSPWKPPLSKTRPPSSLTWKTSNASQLNWTPDLSTAPPQIQSRPWVIFLESKSLGSLLHLKPCSRFLIILRIKSKFLNETPPAPSLWPWLALLNLSVCPALSCTPFLPISHQVGWHTPNSSIRSQFLSSMCSHHHPLFPHCAYYGSLLDSLSAGQLTLSGCLSCDLGHLCPWHLAQGEPGTKEAVRRLSLDKYALFCARFGAVLLVMLHFTISWMRKLRLREAKSLPRVRVQVQVCGPEPASFALCHVVAPGTSFSWRAAQAAHLCLSTPPRCLHLLPQQERMPPAEDGMFAVTQDCE